MMFVVGFICGGICIGTLIMALFLSAGAQTDREAREYTYFEAPVRALEADMPTSEAPAGQGGGGGLTDAE